MIDPLVKQDISFNERDFKIEWYSGTGCGGQNRNKVQSSCRLTHLPTGTVKTAQTRSRNNSLMLAREAIEAELNLRQIETHSNVQNSNRANQIGSGMRGDKIRTYREQDDTVTDHRSNKKVSLKQVLLGNLAILRTIP